MDHQISDHQTKCRVCQSAQAKIEALTDRLIDEHQEAEVARDVVRRLFEAFYGTPMPANAFIPVEKVCDEIRATVKMATVAQSIEKLQ